jgi:MFS family permease
MSIDSLPDEKQAWWRLLNRYQWFVFIVATLGWMFDCMDQQLFAQARTFALVELLSAPGRDPAEAEKAAQLWSGLSTMIWLFGFATGGIFFGILGDRIGRARTMVLTILCYSVFTGLGALSVGPWDFSLYRFLTGLGVGSQFAVGVALVAEVMPDRARPHALAWLQALSAVGNILAGFIGLGMGYLKAEGIISLSPWRFMFLIGILPALLAIVVMRRLKEPERWQALASDKVARQQLGSLKVLFGNPRWRRNAIVGATLAASGVIGLWGIGFFCFELIRAVLRDVLKSPEIPEEALQGQVTAWMGISAIFLNIGSFFGIYAFGRITSWTGRKPAFAVAFVLALLSTVLTFGFFRGISDIFWMVPLMGFCILSLFGGYAIYFPELVPTQLRSTGTSFCYNFARYIAAPGSLTIGLLASQVYGSHGTVMSWRLAGVTMCAIFLLGLVVLPFAPETRGKPLPD